MASDADLDVATELYIRKMRLPRKKTAEDIANETGISPDVIEVIWKHDKSRTRSKGVGGKSFNHFFGEQRVEHGETIRCRECRASLTYVAHDGRCRACRIREYVAHTKKQRVPC